MPPTDQARRPSTVVDREVDRHAIDRVLDTAQPGTMRKFLSPPLVFVAPAMAAMAGLMAVSITGCHHDAPPAPSNPPPASSGSVAVAIHDAGVASVDAGPVPMIG